MFGRSSRASSINFLSKRKNVSSVAFLGLIVFEGEVKMDPEKVRAVVDWPTPTSCTEVHRLRVCQFLKKVYQKSIAASLHALTSKSSFQWNRQAQHAFQRLKMSFTSAPVLTMPDPHLQFVVEVDAPNVRLGNCQPLREIMMLGTVSCSPLRWRWRNGGTGWREPNSRFLSGQFTGI